MDANTVLAEKIFQELRKGPIPKERAKELSSRPWIDHLRSQATDDDLNAISRWIKPSDDEDLIELCIGVARNLSPKGFIDFVKSVQNGNPGLSLRIAAALYLASKGEMDDARWAVQKSEMSDNPTELLRVARYFYATKNDIELKAAIKTRQESGNYTYNEPYYELLLGLI